MGKKIKEKLYTETIKEFYKDKDILKNFKVKSMELKGKAKKDFEKWYANKYYDKSRSTIQNLQRLVFKSLDFSKQYGVYVDFFDSVGLVIDIQPCACHNPTIFNVNIIEPDKDFIDVSEELTRKDARISGIRKANEIYNNKL